MHRIVDGPQTAIAGIGRILPYIFGVRRGINAIPLRVPAQGALREAVTSGSSTFKLNDVDLLRRWPDAGTGQIEGERFTWDGRDMTNVSLTNVSRGTESTAALAHSLGVSLFEKLTEQVYGLFENPGAFAHTRIDVVYVNGLSKPADVAPTHVTTIEDTAAAHDPKSGANLSVGTIRFDLTDPVAASSPYLAPDSLGALQAYEARLGAILGPEAFDLIRLGARGGGADLTGINDPYHALMAGGRIPKLYLLPQINTVSCDVTGIHDDDNGSITGTAGAAITNPAHVTRLILREAFQQPLASFHEASWTAAALACASFGFRWDFEFLPMSLPDFQRTVYDQARLNIFQEGGLWRCVFRRRGSTVMTLEADRRVSWAMNWTPIQDVISTVSATYGEGDQQRTLVANSDRGAKLTAGRTFELPLPWVTNAGMAQDLAEWHLGLRDHQRRKAVALMHSTAIGLTREDTVDADAPMLSAYGGTALAWRVNGVRAQPDATLEISLEEEEPAGLTVSSVVENAAALWLARRRTAQQRRTEAFLVDEAAAEEAALTTKRRRRPLRILV